jgi:hypothetical protein
MKKHSYFAWRLTLCAILLLSMSVMGFAQSFTLTASPKSLTLHPGNQHVAVTISVGSSTYTGPINITFKGLPSGITFTPLTLTAGSSGTVFLSAALNADQEGFPANGPANPNSKSNTVTVAGAVGTVQQTTTMTLVISLTNPSFAPTQVNLPIVKIDTSGTPIVDGTTDVPGTITITRPDGTAILPNATNTDNTATFHLHGHSTALMPKKPYKVKFTTSLDLLTVMGLQCPYVTSKGAPACDKSKSFILLANYDDKSLLRDWAASALANAIPNGGNFLSQQATTGTVPPSPSGTSTVMPWAPHSLYVELYVNGAYQGNYQLIEQVKLDSHRVNVNELKETDITDDITGGYILEIDHRADQAYTWTTPKGIPIGIVDPDFTPDPEVPQQTSYINDYVNQAETALFSPTFTDPATGWRNYFDEAAAVNFYIVNDVMGNVDGGNMYSSDYLYKDKDNQYLYMGPIWDFDISSGNVNYHVISNPTTPWMQTQAPWYLQWFKDPGFKADVVKQWNALKEAGVFNTWINSIKDQAAGLQQSQANNFARWPMLGERIWPNIQAPGSYDAEVAYLTNWLQLRVSYLDGQLNGKKSSQTTLTVPSGTLRTGSPVLLKSTTTATPTPTGQVTLLSNGVVLGMAALDGSGSASGSFTLPAGQDALTAVYNGDATYGLSASTPQTVTVLSPLVESSTNLSASSTSVSQGTSVSFPISVLATHGTTTPTGTVSLKVNGGAFGTATLSGGVLTFTTTALPVGADTIQATYNGDTNFSSSVSPSVTVTVSQGTQTATPVFSPAGGTYSATQHVTISDATSGAVIHYTTNGSTPTTSSTVYSGAITVSSTETLKALAIAPSHTASAVATATYTISSSIPPINYGGGFGSGSGMQVNGKAKFVSGTLELTDGNTSEAGSGFFGNKVAVGKFNTTFTLQLNKGKANGMTFVIQNDALGNKALGPANSALGYSYGPTQTPNIKKSIAVKFDLWTTVGSGHDSTGLYTNAAHPTTPALDMTSSGVNLASGDLLVVTMTYNGTALSMTIKDKTTNASYSHSWTVNIPSIVGASTAYVGFTGSTGGLTAVQQVTNWTFTPTN